MPNPTHATGGRARVNRLAFPHHMGPLLLHAFLEKSFAVNFSKSSFFTPQESKLETKQFQGAERARLPPQLSGVPTSLSSCEMSRN